MDHPTSLGERLRASRKARGLTLQALSRLIGCDAGYLSQLENGKATNPSELLLRGAELNLGVGREWLRTGLGEKGGVLQVDTFEADPRALARFFTDQIRPVKKLVDDLTKCLEALDDLAARMAASPPGANVSYSDFTRVATQSENQRGETAVELASQTQEESRNDVLTDSSSIARTKADVKIAPQWPELKKRLQKATAAIGSKPALAKVLSVDPTQISQWLSESQSAREPGGDYALRMLKWVELQEGQGK